MAPKPTETSPLLPSKLQDAARSSGGADAPSARQERNQRLTRRALCVALPLAALALVALGWLFSGANSGDADASDGDSSDSGSAPRLRDGKHYSDAELLTLLPPFSSRLHPIPPKLIDTSAVGAAIPTNAFWTNFLVGDDHGLNEGGGEVTLSPYTVRSLPRRLDVSYGDTRRVVTSGNVTEYFHADVSFAGYSRRANGSTALLGLGNSTSRSVGAFDPLAVELRYHFEDEAPAAATRGFRALLVRGSPYVTLEYEQLLPVVELNGTLLAVNGERVAPEGERAAPQSFTAARFELDVEVYGAARGARAAQKWLLYFAEARTLRLQFAHETDPRPYNLRGELTTPTTVRLVDADLYSGAVRLAVVPSPRAAALLDTSAGVYPVAAAVSHRVTDGRALVTFNWTTRALSAAGAAAPLLMLAQPHHAATLRNASGGAEVLGRLGHRTVKGNMTAVLGSAWTLEEALPDVGFDAARPVTRPEQLAAIRTSLANDSNYTPEAQDPYFFGKEVARQARLALIADAVDAADAREQLLDALEKWLTPWLVGSNGNHFVYDSVWGGLCSKNGLKGIFWMTDFGNGWYNDHHFHYGYLLYSIAVVAKFRPSFAETHKAPILAITRDIASVDPNDKYFPHTRHFSWFDGHSFASGVYTLDGGKSQESVSEAINAYYGVYLLGQALKLPQIEHAGHVLLALEMRAARTYWQMPAGSDVYEPEFARNKMTGQVAATKVSYTTWFGPEVEHMHLINMIPFTPAAEAFLAPAFVLEEYPVLQEQAFRRKVAPIDDRWRGYAYLALAIIDPPAAWTLVSALDFFDDGSSLTNSLFWIATRPDPAIANSTRAAADVVVGDE